MATLHGVFFPERAMGGKIELDFKVEQWSERDVIERVFAICDRADVGLAAFEASVAAYPDKHITLRHGARVIRDSGSAKARGSAR
ncbi:MAG TPA: hypothetical protein VNB30_11080 [Rhizomicrobium sp.]|jgi:hypothetical protein|nr:hypothetical protein [Rhizomicrobium sp.]